MNTTDNYRSPDEDTPTPDGQQTQADIDRAEQGDQAPADELVRSEVAAPISDSQVQPGRELVDGNGQRDVPPNEATRPDVLVDDNADTQHKREVSEQEHAQTVENKEKDKLNPRGNDKRK